MKNVIKNGQEEDWPKQVTVYTDGASRGNPGPASLGIQVFSPQGEVIYEYAETLGNQTNNFAEYSAVEKALFLAVENGVEDLILHSDSELLIKQLNGQYKVKSASLKPLYLSCKELISRIKKTRFEHVMRENNTRSDELANMALDGY